MSMITKCFLVVFAVLCVLQFVEMTPIPRPEGETSTADDITKQLNAAFQNLLQTVQKLADNEELKTLGGNIQGTLQEGMKKASEAVSTFAKDNKLN